MDPAASWGFIGTIAGAFVGALASIGTTWLNNKNASTLESDKFKAQKIESARAFQRETSIALQDAIHHLAGLAAKDQATLIKSFVAKRDGKPVPELETEEQKEDLKAAFRSVSILRERIANDAIRDLVNRFTKLSAQSHLHDTIASIKDYQIEWALNMNMLILELGSYHRSLFDEFPDNYKKVM
ncbi:MAG: hypothetical protein K0M67_16560 [Thiobacillus sp.]|nr:hypothetical protein [Thiobacillus sp.]